MLVVDEKINTAANSTAFSVNKSVSVDKKVWICQVIALQLHGGSLRVEPCANNIPEQHDVHLTKQTSTQGEETLGSPNRLVNTPNAGHLVIARS